MKKLDKYRIINMDGNKTEWIKLDLNKIIHTIYSVIKKYDTDKDSNNVVEKEELDELNNKILNDDYLVDYKIQMEKLNKIKNKKPNETMNNKIIKKM